jgi:hypothetical protein
MKIKLLSALLLLLIVHISLNAQRYSKNQFTLFSYTYNIDEDVMQKLSTYERNVFYKPEPGQTKTEAVLVHSMYNMLAKTLEDSFQIFMLPSYSLTTKAKYDVYGYPVINIQKAIKLSDTKYFLKLDASLDNDLFDVNGNKLPDNTFKPRITLKLFIYDKYGYVPIQESQGSASAIQPVKLTPEFMSGLNFVDTTMVKTEEQEVLKDIFNRAIIEAVTQLQHKRPTKM